MTNQPFQTMQEVDDYLSGDSIACLVCGRRFPALSHTHIRTHGISHDEYRVRFGIPFTRSLTSAPARAKNRARLGLDYIGRLEQANAARIESPPDRPAARPLAPAVRDQLSKNNASAIVTTACATCGCEIVTSMLVASQPTQCRNCATPAAQRSRETYWRRKAAARCNKQPIVHPRFETAQGVDDYLSGDTITCLICEARMQRLERHLELHRISADEYRERFGIPSHLSLTSAPCRANLRANYLQLIRRCGNKSSFGMGPPRWRNKLS